MHFPNAGEAGHRRAIACRAVARRAIACRAAARPAVACRAVARSAIACRRPGQSGPSRVTCLKGEHAGKTFRKFSQVSQFSRGNGGRAARTASARRGGPARGGTMGARRAGGRGPGEGGGAVYKHVSFQYDQCHAEGRGNGRQGTAAPWPQWAYSFLPGPVPGRGRVDHDLHGTTCDAAHGHSRPLEDGVHCSSNVLVAGAVLGFAARQPRRLHSR